MRAPSRRVAGKSTSSKPGSVSTLASRTKSTTSSKVAAPAPTSNYSLAVSGKGGPPGAIRPTSTSLLGPHTQTTRRARGIRIAPCFLTCPAAPSSLADSCSRKRQGLRRERHNQKIHLNQPVQTGFLMRRPLPHLHQSITQRPARPHFPKSPIDLFL